MNPEIFTLEKQFEPNRILLNKEFNSQDNEEIRTWFFNNFTNHAIDIKNEYYNYLNQLGENIYFFNWLENYFLPSKEISVIDKITTWKLSNDQIIQSIHPPLRKIKINLLQNEFTPSHFKGITENDNQQTQKIIEQNKFSNQHLHIIGKQLDRIENIIQPISPKTNIQLNLKHPIFKPFNILKKHNQKFLNAINQKRHYLTSQITE